MYIFIRQPEENLDIHPYQLYEVYAKNGILNISYGETFSRIFYLIKGYKTTNRIQILSNTLFVPVNLIDREQMSYMFITSKFLSKCLNIWT